MVAFYVWSVRGRPAANGAAVAGVDDPARLEQIRREPHALFVNSAFDAGNGRAALAPLDALNDPRVLTPLRCERIDFSAGTGVCLSANRGVLTTYYANVFDDTFKVRHRIPLQGVPSRVQVSPDGTYAAFTVFVAGDSYTNSGFSTRTTIITTADGAPIGDLEGFAASRDGRPFKEVDFNYWGVTFAHERGRFYATLASGGHTYLVEGDVGPKTIRVMRDGVECPSLSPDDRRIVYKARRTENGRVLWRLHVFDLITGADTPITETRSVDDQAAWLDDEHVLYGLPDDSGAGFNIWVAPANGGGTARVWLHQAYSPAVVQRESLISTR